MRIVESSYKTASGIIFTGSGMVYDVLIGTDGTNDVALTIYNGLSATNTKELLPTVTYDASALGLNGYTTSIGSKVNDGCYVEITCSGACEVVIKWEKI